MLTQIAIAMTGVIAIWLSQDSDAERRRYACLFGLAGQPFWIYAAYSAEQWGILVLTFFYTWAWLKGARNNWFRRSA